MSVLMRARDMESIRPPSQDERRAQWAAKYFAMGLHRRSDKPRIRVTVPQPIPQRDPALTGKDK